MAAIPTGAACSRPPASPAWRSWRTRSRWRRRPGAAGSRWRAAVLPRSPIWHRRAPSSGKKPSASVSTWDSVERRRWCGPAISPRITSGSTPTTRPDYGFALVVSRGAVVVAAFALCARRRYAFAFDVSACCDALGLAGAAAGCCAITAAGAARVTISIAVRNINDLGLGSLLRPLRSTPRHASLRRRYIRQHRADAGQRIRGGPPPSPLQLVVGGNRHVEQPHAPQPFVVGIHQQVRGRIGVEAVGDQIG